MTHSTLDRQSATTTDDLEECDQQGTNLRNSGNSRTVITPVLYDGGSENTTSTTARPVYEDSDRSTSVSQPEGIHTKQPVPPKGKDAGDMEDSQRLFRELEHEAHGLSGKDAEKAHAEFDNSKRADMSGLVMTTTQHHTVGDNPKEMLKELNRRYWAAKGLGSDHKETNHLTGSKAMLLDTEESRVFGLDAHQGTKCDLETASKGSTTKRLPLDSLAPQHALRNSAPMAASYPATTSSRHAGAAIADALDPDTTPYAVALMLENAGCKWEQVKGWTLHLFSSGMDEYRAKQGRKIREKAKFDAILAYARELEEKDIAVEKNPFAGRLVLSNLATDADRTSIYQFFSKYQKDIRDITVLPQCDTIARTRTAYVDMHSRKATVHASFERGYIFGLAVKIKRAVE